MVPDVIPSYTDTHSSLTIPIVFMAFIITAIFAAIIIATAAEMVISGISNAAEIWQEMVHRRQAASNEQGVDLAVAGAANDVQLAERVECRAFFQVEASAPPEGGHSVDTQPQDVLPDIKGRIVNYMQRGQGPGWSLLFGMTKSLREAYFLKEKLD
jgi:hypothetical protein